MHLLLHHFHDPFHRRFDVFSSTAEVQVLQMFLCVGSCIHQPLTRCDLSVAHHQLVPLHEISALPFILLKRHGGCGQVLQSEDQLLHSVANFLASTIPAVHGPQEPHCSTQTWNLCTQLLDHILCDGLDLSIHCLNNDIIHNDATEKQTFATGTASTTCEGRKRPPALKRHAQCIEPHRQEAQPPVGHLKCLQICLGAEVVDLPSSMVTIACGLVFT
mmetsp:Transcript_64533/g.154146  ORF Transcript_64533/g.154146 Transcript_64533/m.154146 type:complete len:217 (-) Transcript_64533:1942-2592(-)